MNIGKENESVEFKESLSELEDGLKSLSAMLNRNGHGTVYFGVNDNGDINKKITVGSKTLLEIRNKAKNLIEPQIVLKLDALTSDEGYEYISVSASGFDIPYSCNGRFYIRTAASDEKIPTAILRKMLLNSDVDVIKQIRAKEQDLSFQQLTVLLAARGYHVTDNEQFHKSFSLLNEESKFNQMAYLLSDRNDITIKIVRFDGNDKTDMSTRTEHGNRCLVNSVNAVLDYFKMINTTKVDLSEGVRKEISLFDYEAFREAWINACLHNSWQEELSPAIFLFDNRTEIVSYGGLTYRLTKEEFFKGVSMPVNRSLLTVFTDVGLAEHTGHGIPRIVQSYGQEAFSFAENMITVTIPFNYESEYAQIRKEKERQAASFSENQKNILRYLQEHSAATIREIATHLEMSVPGTQKIMAKLQKDGFLQREGSKKTGVWKVMYFGSL